MRIVLSRSLPDSVRRLVLGGNCLCCRRSCGVEVPAGQSAIKARPRYPRAACRGSSGCLARLQRSNLRESDGVRQWSLLGAGHRAENCGGGRSTSSRRETPFRRGQLLSEVGGAECRGKSLGKNVDCAPAHGKLARVTPAALHHAVASALVPLPFYALSVAYGSVPIFLPVWWPFSYYNIRYGIELLPAFAVFGPLGIYLVATLIGDFKVRVAITMALWSLSAAVTHQSGAIRCASARPGSIPEPPGD